MFFDTKIKKDSVYWMAKKRQKAMDNFFEYLSDNFI